MVFRHGVILGVICIILTVSAFLPVNGAVTISGMYSQQNPSAGGGTPVIAIPSLFLSGAATGPVSRGYSPPPGVMPVIILEGSPYEMGYQYGLQAGESIAMVRDAAWASALSTQTPGAVVAAAARYNQYIISDMKGFDYSSFFKGISDAMNRQGMQFDPLDLLVILYWGNRQGPSLPEHCTSFAIVGNTPDDDLIVGDNFDYYQVPANSYQVLLAFYPQSGYPCLVPSGSGRTGSNMVMNGRGLTYISAAGPSAAAGDTGPGITGFLYFPYLGMTCGSVAEAETVLTCSTRMFALNHLLADPVSGIEVLESTRQRTAVRRPGDHNETGYLVMTNHYLEPAMKPSQPVWEPKVYYPSSYFRYITAEKMIRDTRGQWNYSMAIGTLGLTDWWDGSSWHSQDPWSTNTINRFRPDVATIYSAVVVPGKGLLSLCTGNPGVTTWGNLAPGQTGVYVNYTIGNSPASLVFSLKNESDRVLWTTVQVIGLDPSPSVSAAWEECLSRYGEAVWWLDRSYLENDTTMRTVALGRSATLFSEVIAKAGSIRNACNG